MSVGTRRPVLGEHDRTSRMWELLAKPAWAAEAACRDAPKAWFYPDLGGDAGRAKQVCARCPVRAECLAAGQREAHGVWGGMTPKERRRAARVARRQAEQQALADSGWVYTERGQT